MDMSLDEIIMNKKGISGVGIAKKIGGNNSKPRTNKIPFKPTQRIQDARNKIIQKNRLKIRDARDKLAEITRSSNIDARSRILARKQLTNGNHGGFKSDNMRQAGRMRRGFMPPTKQLTNGLISSRNNYMGKRLGINTSSHRPELVVPRGYVDYDNMEEMEQEEFAAASLLSRTVQNDIARSAYSRSFNHSTVGLRAPESSSALRHMNSWNSNSDPFDVYEIPSSDRRIQLPPPPPKGILRSSIRQPSPPSPPLYERHYIPENSHLSYEMRSRLQHAPDPHASMGIFANTSKTNNLSANGYRIVVSNLHTSVSQSDIKELFEDIGELLDSRIVRPGVAEVIYRHLKDAEQAVDTYHNRQLDGQPMKCLLVNPRASDKPTAPAIKTSSSRDNSGKTPLEIDIDALHKVLFRRH